MSRAAGTCFGDHALSNIAIVFMGFSRKRVEVSLAIFLDVDELPFTSGFSYTPRDEVSQRMVTHR